VFVFSVTLWQLDKLFDKLFVVSNAVTALFLELDNMLICG